MSDRALRLALLLLLWSSVRLTESAFWVNVISHANVRPNGVTSSIQAQVVAIFSHSNKSENEPEIIYVDEAGGNNDEVPDGVLDELKASQPSELEIMKDVSSV